LLRDTVYQFQQGRSRVALHAQCGHLQQPVVAFLRTRQCLFVRGGDRLGYAVKEHSGERVSKSEQSLLRVAQFPDLAANPVKARRYPFFSLTVNLCLSFQFFSMAARMKALAFANPRCRAASSIC
jgi:hypothetical protein